MLDITRNPVAVEPPLRRTLRQAAAITAGGQPPVAGDAAGWEPADAIADDRSLLAAQLEPASRNAPGRVAGALWMIEARAWYAAELVAATLLLAGRVPRLDPASVDVLIGPEGQAAAVRPRGTAFHCRAGDRDAGHPDARVAADEPALLAAARDELIAVCGPLVAAVDASGLRRARVAWRSVGDRVVQALGHVGDLTGRRDAAWGMAAAIMAPASPLRVPVAFELRDGASFGYRATCCLSYRDASCERCDSCPVLAPRRR